MTRDAGGQNVRNPLSLKEIPRHEGRDAEVSTPFRELFDGNIFR